MYISLMSLMSESISNKPLYSGYIYDGSTQVCLGNLSTPRKCRFCRLEEPDASFDNDTAHAISESLGNVNIISNDECKSCNHIFSVFEQGFYRAHAPMLMMCGIGGKDNGKRKSNAKSVAGADCRISFSEDGMIIHLNNTDFDDFYHEAELNHIFSLNPVLKFENFRPIDIYKSLCKYVLSIIPNELVPNFQPTISWLLGKRTLDSLPNVVTSITQLTNHPIVGYFIRQNETCSPYSVGFFRFAMLTYVFIIPGANDEYSYPNVILS